VKISNQQQLCLILSERSLACDKYCSLFETACCVLSTVYRTHKLLSTFNLEFCLNMLWVSTSCRNTGCKKTFVPMFYGIVSQMLIHLILLVGRCAALHTSENDMFTITLKYVTALGIFNKMLQSQTSSGDLFTYRHSLKVSKICPKNHAVIWEKQICYFFLNTV